MEIKSTLTAIVLLVFSFANAQNQSQNKPAPGNSLEFIPNKGQVADTKGRIRQDILYIAHDGPINVFLRNKGFSFVINTLRNPKLAPGYKDDDDDDDDNYKGPRKPKKELLGHTFGDAPDTSRTCRIDMDFVGTLQPLTQNISPSEGFLNYYLPQCPNGITHVKAFQNVFYKGIYPKIDVSFKGTYSKGLKYDIIVSPGGNPDLIKMKYTGAEKVEIKEGKLLISAFTGNLEERIPKIYQVINGEEINIEGNYVLYHQGKDSADGTVVGIKIKNYNKEYPLIIDPWWVTYCGGSGSDVGYSTAIDNAGNTVLTGSTSSSNFPVTVGAFQTSLLGGSNAFVIKFDPGGNRLWATYYGGGSDIGYGITTDINNNVLFAGSTSSSGFPVSGGAFQSSYGGGTFDAFVVKLDPGGVRLWGTFCGGSGADEGYAITSDYLGNVAITGSTKSTNFPVSAGAFQTVLGGVNGNAYVMKFDPNGNQVFGTYFGGNAILTGGYGVKGDIAYGISADAYGNLAFAGGDASTNFPITVGCFQSTQGYGFVAEVDALGNRLWATYFGGTGAGSLYPNGITGCAVDKSNNVAIAGISLNGTGIVATPGVYQTTFTSGNGFAAKFNPSGNLAWTTFVNIGNDECGVMSMAVDESDNVYTVQEPDPGNSYTSPSCAFQSPPPPTEELYVIKLDSNGRYACSTYIGGNNYDSRSLMPGACLAEKAGRMACVTYTGGGIPVTPGAFQTTDPSFNFAPGVFNLCAFGCGDTTRPVLSLSTINVTTPDSCIGYANFTAHGSAPCDSAGAIYLWSFPGGYPSTATGPIISSLLYTSPGTYSVTLKFIACSIDSVTQTFTIKSGFHDSMAINSGVNCHQLGQATANPAGGIPPYTYSWSDGSTNQSDTGLAPGTYTCVVTSNNGCSATTVVTIKRPIAPPFITKPRDTGYCYGGRVPLSVSGGSGFLWSPSVGLSCTSCPNPIASPTATTTYTITGLDSAGCSDSALVMVQVDSLPLFGLRSTAEACGGYTYLAATTSSDSRNWTWTWAPTTDLTYSGLPYNEATPTVQITYTLTASNGFCSSSDTITVGPINKSSSLSIKASPDTMCRGAIVSLTSSSSDKLTIWRWTPLAGLSCHTCANTSLNTGVIIITGNTYTVALEAEDSVGCIAYDTVTLYFLPGHNSYRSTSVCKGTPATLIAPSSSTYNWSTGATTSSINVTPTVTTSYYVIVDSAACFDSVYYNVIVDSVPLISITAIKDTICPGDTALLIGGGGGTYHWSIGSSADSINVFPITVQTYTLTVTKNGCKDSLTKTINIYTKGNVNVSLSRDSICPYDTVVMTASGGSSYLWNNSSTTSSITVSPGSTKTYTIITQAKCFKDTIVKTIYVVPNPAPVISGIKSVCKGKSDTLYASGGTTYLWSNGSTSTSVIITLTKDSTVTLEAFNGKCYKDTTIKLNVIPSPVVTISPSVKICSGDTVTLNATGGGTYHWSNGSKDSTIKVSDTANTTYSVLVTNAKGCTAAATTKITIDVPALFACCDSTIFIGNSALLYADSSLTYKWSPSTGLSCDSCPEIIVTPTVTTTYTIVGVDKTGCEVRRTLTIIVEEPCSDYFVPNVFTPNGDDVNDKFEIKAENLTSFSIVIYDRWGKEMYKSNNPDVYWNGDTEEGAKAPTGVYYYIIASTCRNNTYKKDGFVQLIR